MVEQNDTLQRSINARLGAVLEALACMSVGKVARRRIARWLETGSGIDPLGDDWLGDVQAVAFQEAEEAPSLPDGGGYGG